MPATALTQSLSRVFCAVAEGRMDPKQAIALSRIATALLKSITGSTKEFQECYKERYWRQLIYSQYKNLPKYITDDDQNNPPEPAPASLLLFQRQPPNSQPRSMSASRIKSLPMRTCEIPLTNSLRFRTYATLSKQGTCNLSRIRTYGNEIEQLPHTPHLPQIHFSQFVVDATRSSP